MLNQVQHDGMAISKTNDPIVLVICLFVVVTMADASELDIRHLARFRSHKIRTFNKSNPDGDSPLKAGGSLTLLDYKGAGQIVRLHLTNGWSDPQISRKVLLKIY